LSFSLVRHNLFGSRFGSSRACTANPQEKAQDYSGFGISPKHQLGNRRNSLARPRVREGSAVGCGRPVAKYMGDGVLSYFGYLQAPSSRLLFLGEIYAKLGAITEGLKLRFRSPTSRRHHRRTGT